MNYASAAAALLLATMLGVTAYADFIGHPKVVEVLNRLQIPVERRRILGAIKTLGALGLVGGIFATSLGVAASFGLCLYFSIAVAAHARAGDTIRQMLPVVPFLFVALFGLFTTIAK